MVKWRYRSSPTFEKEYRVSTTPSTSSMRGEKGKGRKPPSWLAALLVVVAMGVSGSAVLAGMMIFARHSPKTVIAAPIFNANRTPKAVTAQNAKRMLLTFLPVQDTETVGDALLHATGHPGSPVLAVLGPDMAVRQGTHHRWHITVSVPVNVAYLMGHGEVTAGHFPGASDLATGHLYVAGNLTGYSINMNPKTHVAVFRFALSPDDLSIWALNWNALGIVSQNEPLN